MSIFQKINAFFPNTQEGNNRAWTLWIISIVIVIFIGMFLKVIL